MTRQDNPMIVWDAEMTLLTNRFFLYDMAKLMFWLALLAGGLFSSIAAATGGAEAVLQMLRMFALILAGFLFLFVAITAVFFGNRYPVRFLIAPQGIAWESRSRRASATNRIAIIAGALSGSLSTAGAGLLAAASESGLMEWGGIRKVRAYPDQRVITLMNSWRVVTRLYCTPQNFGEVLESIRQHATAAAIETAGGAVVAGQSGTAPSAAVEYARRLLLLGGLCACLWLAFYSRPVLIEARRADFEKEYQRKYGERSGPVMGVMGAAREFLRRNTDPGSVDGFIAESTENRLIPAQGPEFANLYRRIEGGPVWFAPEDAPAAAIWPRIRDILGRTHWTSTYLPVSSEGPRAYLEFRYNDRPRESKAPRDMVYPRRAGSWIWLVAGILTYLLMPWPKPASFDRTVTCSLDFLGAIFAGLFFAVPLYWVYATADVFGDDLVQTILFWCLAACSACLLLWSARLAARARG